VCLDDGVDKFLTLGAIVEGALRRPVLEDFVDEEADKVAIIEFGPRRVERGAGGNCACVISTGLNSTSGNRPNWPLRPCLPLPTWRQPAFTMEPVRLTASFCVVVA
jgi:hypothetical protein